MKQLFFVGVLFKTTKLKQSLSVRLIKSQTRVLGIPSLINTFFVSNVPIRLLTGKEGRKDSVYSPLSMLIISWLDIYYSNISASLI